MSITAITSGTEVSSLLRGSTLASYQSRLIETETEELQQQSSTISTQSFDTEAFRQALTEQIDSDVEAGMLSEEEAVKVKEALGLAESESDDTAESSEEPSETASASGVGGIGGGGSGGGSESEPSEVSRSETIVNGVKTTVILYDDGSTETQVSYTTSPDNPEKPLVASAYGQEDAESYLLTLAHGSFVDIRA